MAMLRSVLLLFSRSRSSLLGKFTSQSQKTMIKVSELAISLVPFDPDEDRLYKLRELLQSEQNCLNELKLEQGTLNDLGQFADDVAVHGTVPPADRMAVAVTFSEALKAIEDLRQDCQGRASRIYATILNVIKQAFQKLLEDLAELQSTALALDDRSIDELPYATATLQAFTNIRFGHDGISARMEQLRGEIQLLAEAGLLEKADVGNLESKRQEVVDDALRKQTFLDKQKRDLDDRIRELVSMKLYELRGWLPILHKRSEQNSGIGPDLMTVKKQIQEMKVVEKQSQEKSVMSIIEGDDVIILPLLADETIRDIQAANDEWLAIRRWIATRTKRLDQALEAWDLFRRCEIDLQEYLRENEKLLKNRSDVDLSDPASVEARHVELKGIMTNMEARKVHVKAYQDASDQLIASVDTVEAIVITIRSQVSEMHLLWNSVVKQVIEARSELEAARKKFEALHKDMTDVRVWLDDAIQAIQVINTDSPKDLVEDALRKLEKHRQTYKVAKSTVDRMNCLSEEVLAASNGPFTISDRLLQLNKDWIGMETKLRVSPKKPWYDGVVELIQLIKRLFLKCS